MRPPLRIYVIVPVSYTQHDVYVLPAIERMKSPRWIATTAWRIATTWNCFVEKKKRNPTCTRTKLILILHSRSKAKGVHRDKKIKKKYTKKPFQIIVIDIPRVKV